MENIIILNGYCNLVNKLFYFIQNNFEGIVPAGRLDEEIYWKTKRVFDQESTYLREGRKNEVIGLLSDYLSFADQYFEEGNIGDDSVSDRRICRNTTLNSIQLVANLTILLTPLASHPADQVCKWLELGDKWEVKRVHSGYELSGIQTISCENDQIGA